MMRPYRIVWCLIEWKTKRKITRRDDVDSEFTYIYIYIYIYIHQDASTISSSHYSNREATRYCSMVRFKEECSLYRIDGSLGRKPKGGAWTVEKPIRDTVCRLVGKGWICHVIPIEVGCRGFLGNSVISFLSKIGITSRSLKVASNHIQTTVQYLSIWIWSKLKSFQHE